MPRLRSRICPPGPLPPGFSTIQDRAPRVSRHGSRSRILRGRDNPGGFAWNVVDSSSPSSSSTRLCSSAVLLPNGSDHFGLNSHKARTIKATMTMAILNPTSLLTAEEHDHQEHAGDDEETGADETHRGPPETGQPSVGLADEDERGALYDGRAGADERDVDVLHLALAGAARRLQRALDDMPEAVDAPGAQAPAEGVQRQLAVQLHAAVLDEVQRLALLAEAVGLEAVDDRRGEAVVDLRDVDVLR